MKILEPKAIYQTKEGYYFYGQDADKYSSTSDNVQEAYGNTDIALMKKIDPKKCLGDLKQKIDNCCYIDDEYGAFVQFEKGEGNGMRISMWCEDVNFPLGMRLNQSQYEKLALFFKNQCN